MYPSDRGCGLSRALLMDSYTQVAAAAQDLRRWRAKWNGAVLPARMNLVDSVLELLLVDEATGATRGSVSDDTTTESLSVGGTVAAVRHDIKHFNPSGDTATTGGDEPDGDEPDTRDCAPCALYRLPYLTIRPNDL